MGTETRTGTRTRKGKEYIGSYRSLEEVKERANQLKQNPALVAWMAGFFDGEGAIMITKKEKPKRARSEQYSVEIQVTNTVRELVKWFQDNFGGYFGESYGYRKRSTYRWYCKGRFALNFLNLIYPYVWLKKKRIEIAFKFQQVLDSDKPPVTCKRSDEVSNWLEYYRNLIRVCNGRRESESMRLL